MLTVNDLWHSTQIDALVVVRTVILDPADCYSESQVDEVTLDTTASVIVAEGYS